MPKNEEFSRSVENAEIELDKNSNEIVGNGTESKSKKSTNNKKTNAKTSGVAKSVKVEKDSKSKADKSPKATAKKASEPKKATGKNTGNKDVKGSTKNTAKATTKTSNTNAKKTNVKTTTTNKKTSSNNKRTTEKVVASKKTETKKVEVKETKKEVKKVEPVKAEVKEEKSLVEKPNEQTIIEKIKSFLAKIAAMQEEARKEFQDKKEAKVKAKEASKEAKEAKKAAEKEAKKPEYLLEYYDLPYRYNETIVKILAQTPKKLFVYWDLSDNDRTKYVNAFGDDFFNKTYPVLLVYNEDKKYIREIVINDFANSWYINIDDPKTKYTIQLGRKFKEKPTYVNFAELEINNIILKTDYLPIADSNKLEVPNDHVLLETLPRFIIFRNVKTGEEVAKDLGQMRTAIGKAYNVKEFYEEQYKDEVTGEIFDMKNPSSKLTSSMFK